MNGTSSWHGGRGADDARISNEATARASRLGAWLRRGSGAVGLLALIAVGCKASVQGDAKVSTQSDDPIASYDRPLEGPQKKAAPAENDFTHVEYALLGARHDLNYAGPKSAACACLAVALRDQAQDAAFQWELEAPKVEPNTQWIIALSSNDVPCDSPPSGTLGASYQGYGTDGNDVVVYVEALGEGRPMTSGAIIPRPKPSGSVFVESTNGVYGKPLDGKSKRCKLTAPGGAKP
ncbi:MAG TPA: hypothetical protein VMG12_32695 [Polyangiaceae bacterium]|nr:hypothetical protein [Polyangiaceae bacterium]